MKPPEGFLDTIQKTVSPISRLPPHGCPYSPEYRDCVQLKAV
jgi:hypothetical protein